jgi:putative Mn2+ efflux pump MntP
VVQVFVLAVLLSLNNFFGAVALGAAELAPRERLRVVVLFAAADCGLPLIGIALGSDLAQALGRTAAYLGAGVIMATAVYVALSGRGGHAGPPTSAGPLLLTAIGLGLDNLGAGLGLGAMGFPPLLTLATFGLVTAGVTVLGLVLGRAVYRRLAGRNINGLSGAVLFVTGAAMLISRLRASGG